MHRILWKKTHRLVYREMIDMKVLVLILSMNWRKCMVSNTYLNCTRDLMVIQLMAQTNGAVRIVVQLRNCKINESIYILLNILGMIGEVMAGVCLMKLIIKKIMSDFVNQFFCFFFFYNRSASRFGNHRLNNQFSPNWCNRFYAIIYEFGHCSSLS